SPTAAASWGQLRSVFGSACPAAASPSPPARPTLAIAGMALLENGGTSTIQADARANASTKPRTSGSEMFTQEPALRLGICAYIEVVNAVSSLSIQWPEEKMM